MFVRFIIVWCIRLCHLVLQYSIFFADTRMTPSSTVRSISEISSCFFGPRPWHIEIRHRVKKTSTMNMFGFETLKLKIRRLKLWKPTVQYDPLCPFPEGTNRATSISSLTHQRFRRVLAFGMQSLINEQG